MTLVSEDGWSVADLHFMQMALSLAGTAASRGEVPVGAVLVEGEEVVATGFNLRETHQDPTAHAELLALRQAAITGRRWRLTSCRLYVTLEPCLMCAGAILQARLGSVIYGARDPKAGAMGSLYQVQDDSRLNHKVMLRSGLLADPAAELLKAFFQARRKGQ